MPATHPDLDDRLAAALRAHGRRVTPQRLVLHRALHEIGRHATVEEVARVASRRVPGIASPTAYAVLELLDELGLARRVTVPDGPVLYDPRTDGHVHLSCRSCGRVCDVDATVHARAAIAAAVEAGARVDGAELVLAGLCPECAGSD